LQRNRISKWLGDFKASGMTKNQMEGYCAEGLITDIRDARMKEKSRK
jgi:hypothetical protein